MRPMRKTPFLRAFLVGGALLAGCGRPSLRGGNEGETRLAPAATTAPSSLKTSAPLAQKRAATPLPAAKPTPPSSAAPSPEKAASPRPTAAKPEGKPQAAAPAAPKPSQPVEKGTPKAPKRAPAEAVSTSLPKETSSDVPLIVQGEIVVASHVPEPGTVPYTECLTFIKYKVLAVEKGDYPHPEILTVQWGMKDNQLTPAARYKVGETHRLLLEPFDKHPELSRVMQADDTNEYELTPYWVR